MYVVLTFFIGCDCHQWSGTRDKLDAQSKVTSDAGMDLSWKVGVETTLTSARGGQTKSTSAENRMSPNTRKSVKIIRV